MCIAYAVHHRVPLTQKYKLALRVKGKEQGSYSMSFSLILS